MINFWFFYFLRVIYNFFLFSWFLSDQHFDIPFFIFISPDWRKFIPMTIRRFYKNCTVNAFMLLFRNKAYGRIFEQLFIWIWFLLNHELKPKLFKLIVWIKTIYLAFFAHNFNPFVCLCTCLHFTTLSYSFNFLLSCSH